VTELKQDLAALRIDHERPRRSTGRRPLFVALGIAALALILGGLFLLRARLFAGGLEVDTVRPTLTPAAGASVGAPILTATGYVVPRRKAVVSAKIQGRLAELRVEEGSRVPEGEVIARLESADFAAQVQQARAALQRALADLEESRRLLRQTDRLARETVASQDQLEAARSRVAIGDAMVEQARADLALSEARFRDTQIRAPFAGVVLRKMAEVGESVAPITPGVNLSTSSGAIVALADLDTLEVEADVSESNVARLGTDQPAEVSVEAFPDRRYRAVLRQVIPTADRTKATVQVKVTILDKDRDLKPEMTARVVFVEPEKAEVAGVAPPAAPWISVPQETLVMRDGKSFVFEVRDGRARAREVVTGVTRQGLVVVRQGLGGSETLVTRPPETLKDGDAVRVRG
jgi:RND family efflux transporter MFP subunit